MARLELGDPRRRVAPAHLVHEARPCAPRARASCDLEHGLGVLLARAREVEGPEEDDVVGDSDLGVHEVVDLGAPGSTAWTAWPRRAACESRLRAGGSSRRVCPFSAHWWNTVSVCGPSTTPAMSRPPLSASSASVAEDRPGGDHGRRDSHPAPRRADGRRDPVRELLTMTRGEPGRHRDPADVDRFRVNLAAARDVGPRPELLEVLPEARGELFALDDGEHVLLS